MINAKVEGGRHLENHFRDLCAAAAAAEQPTSDVPQLGWFSGVVVGGLRRRGEAGQVDGWMHFISDYIWVAVSGCNSPIE
jgi:hypothetical protein